MLGVTISKSDLPAPSGKLVSIENGALSTPVSLHMPAAPFEAEDDLWIDGVDEDYGDV
jgi:hypothetical protein